MRTINNLVITNSGFLPPALATAQQPAKLFRVDASRRIGRCTAGYDNDVTVQVQQVLVTAKHLAQTAFDTITHHRRANAFRHGQTQT
jgi:hypothetical protein